MSIKRLKEALINALVEQVEGGAILQDKETGEALRVSCPAPVLAVAAKVVKDFHGEITPDKTEALKDAVNRYRLVKAGRQEHSQPN
jgi:hypothetical protein